MPGRSLQKNSAKDQKKIVPFGVWIITGILFISIVAVAHLFPDRQTDLPDETETAGNLPEEFDQSKLERLSAWAAEGDGFPGVVVVGTSLTQSAFFPDEEMEKFAVRNGFGGLRFIQFSRRAARPEDFIPLLDFISKAKPDFLFLESNLFGIEFLHRDNTRNKLRFYIKKMLGIRKRATKRPERNNLPEGGLRQNNDQQGQTGTDFIRYRNFIRNAGLRPFSLLPREYKMAVEDLRRGGTKIVLLDMPRSAKAASAYPPGFLDEARLMTRLYELTYGWLHWDPPEYPDLDYYSDFAHMNEKGRVAYSLWFLEKISRISKGHDQ